MSGDISMTTVYVMDDLILFEIYEKHIGFADFMVPTFTKHRTDAFMTLKLHRKRQIGYSKMLYTPSD